jgi:uncharacterized protein (TIGR03083 family)
MNYEDHIASVERETAAITEALSAAARDVPVPTCPDWRFEELAKHVGEFTGLWTHVLCEGTGREKTPWTPPPDDGDLAGWYAPIAGYLVQELRATEPDQRVWSWIEDQQHAAMVARRCSNELAIHRFDAQSASGTSQAIDAAVAADAIDEIFVMIPAWDGAHEGSGRSLHVHGNDSDDEWTIVLAPDGPGVRREHTDDADLTLSGQVSDLALLLFGRPTLGPVGRAGEPAVLDAWYEEFTFG